MNDVCLEINSLTGFSKNAFVPFFSSVQRTVTHNSGQSSNIMTIIHSIIQSSSIQSGVYNRILDTYNVVPDGHLFSSRVMINTKTDNNIIMVECVNEDEFQNKIEKTLETIQSFSDLPEEWDGYDAEKINNDVIQFAKKVLMTFSQIPNVFPTLDGNVQFQFREGRRKYLQIKVFHDHKISIYKRENGNQIESKIICFDDATDKEHLLKLVDDFER